MHLTNIVIQKIVRKLLAGEDYRVEIVDWINAEFLQYAIEFFKKVVDAKLKNQEVGIEWYKQEFLNSNVPTDDLIIHAGLNKKTISNMHRSARREVVLKVVPEYFEQLYEMVDLLAQQSEEVDLNLTIKFQKVSVELNLTESLMVINTLAVKRAEIRGGAWSTAGKRVEYPLMLTLCNVFSVPPQYYAGHGLTDLQREVDFYLIDASGKKYNCEVKLMGQGNPESADAVIARDTQIFVADTLSETNKRQLDHLGVQWVELRANNGYRKFYDILQHLGIPSQSFDGELQQNLDMIFKAIFIED
jgi:hypothetical protein